MEEYDFSFRALNKGYCIKYDDSVTVLHKESPLGRTTKIEKLRMMWVNKTKVAWRYLPKKYFYTTVILWSLLFIRKTNFNWSYFVKGWKDIFKIRRTEERTPINNKALKYLKKTEARLWY
jgi:GT2 family glycosyltransferase